MAQTQLSPKPSPDGPPSILFEPPPVKKPVARRLHELQDPNSPTKAPKLMRTESFIDIVPIDLGESFLSVPVDLNGMSFMTDPKELDEATSNMYDTKGKAPKDPYSSSSNDKPPLDPRNCPLLLTSRKKNKSPNSLADILNTPPTTKSAPGDKKTPSSSRGKCSRISQSHDNVFLDSSDSDEEHK